LKQPVSNPARSIWVSRIRNYLTCIELCIVSEIV
jgi:hypothetical protein